MKAYEEHVRVYNAAGLGAAVRHFREAEGLTQTQLAEQAGLDRFYVARLENGKTSEQLERLVELLKLLGARITIGRAEW